MNNKALTLCILLSGLTTTALAQIAPNNNYAEMLTHSNLMLQNSMSQTIAMQAQRKALGNALGATSAPTAPDSGSQDPAVSNAPTVDYTPPAVNHIPMTATDFVPIVRGHPAVDQILFSMPITPRQRAQLRLEFADMSDRIASGMRPDNLAVAMSYDMCMATMAVDDRVANDLTGDCYHLAAVNDRLGSSPQIAAMSDLQKQNLSDTLIFQGMMIQSLRLSGRFDPRAKIQSTQVAHTVLQQLTGSPMGLSF
jgi:hypothetical protein